jgi:hypothetical protein
MRHKHIILILYIWQKKPVKDITKGDLLEKKEDLEKKEKGAKNIISGAV